MFLAGQIAEFITRINVGNSNSITEEVIDAI